MLNLKNIFFVIFFIVNRCCMSSDAETTLKPSQTTLQPVEQLSTSTMDKGLLNVTEAASQNKSNDTEERAADSKLTEAAILNNTKCDEMKKEVCKAPLQSWNQNTCKCEEEVTSQNVTVGSNQNSTFDISTRLSPLENNTTDIPKKTIWTPFGEISFRTPFLPRLG